MASTEVSEKRMASVTSAHVPSASLTAEGECVSFACGLRLMQLWLLYVWAPGLLATCYCARPCCCKMPLVLRNEGRLHVHTRAAVAACSLYVASVYGRTVYLSLADNRGQAVTLSRRVPRYSCTSRVSHAYPVWAAALTNHIHYVCSAASSNWYTPLTREAARGLETDISLNMFMLALPILLLLQDSLL